MWSDNLTEKALSQEQKFDLTCNHPERGQGVVEKDLSLEQAVKIAEEGGVEDAQFKLECAWSDQICIEIERPGKHPEMLVPHDWS